jgi:CubicO group peptidase (beta-lactamase class C family)
MRNFFPFSILLFSLMCLLVACSKDDGGIPPETPNSAPVITIAPDISGVAAQRLSVAVEIRDPEGDALTITMQGLPAALSYVKDSMRIIGVPLLSDTGTHTVRIVADDGKIKKEVSFVLNIFANEFGQKQFFLGKRLQASFASNTPGLPGVSLSVINEKNEIFSVATGTRVVGQTNDPLLPAHRFRVASSTKSMVAAIVLKLAEEGKIGLDQPVNKYISNPLPNASTVTIRQLLNHTSGLYDHLNANSFWSNPINTASKVWSLDELISLGNAAGSLFVPGTKFAYSNTGYVVLGKVIEAVSGKPIAQAFKDILFQPVGMANALYDNSTAVPNVFTDLATNNRSYEYSPTAAGPAGAVVCNASDLAKFGRAAYGAHFLKNASVAEMITNYGKPLGGQDYGLGTRLWTLNGILHHGHTGAFMDYRSIVIYIPENKMSIAIITHGVHTNWFTLVDDLMLYAYGAL